MNEPANNNWKSNPWFWLSDLPPKPQRQNTNGHKKNLKRHYPFTNTNSYEPPIKIFVTSYIPSYT